MALAGMFVVGCNENPGDTDPDPTTVAPATALMAESMDGAVALKWTASADAESYTVTWSDGSATGKQTATGVTDTEVMIDELTNGTTYTFEVIAVDADDEESAAATISWAPAARYESDVKNSGTLRLYPRSVAGKGSGIVIQQTGAYTASVAAGSPDLGQIHLIGDITSSTISIGVPKSFTNLTQQPSFRSDVQISDTYVEVASLDNWYNSASLENLFTSNSQSNFSVGDKLPGGLGMAFAMRWGTAGSYKYSRIFVVPSSTGNLVQFDAGGDPYIEVQISYQGVNGVPYAK